MALINCKECGEQVSTKAASCPKCGAPVSNKNKGPSGCMMVVLIIAGLIILLLFVGNASKKDESSESVNIGTNPRAERQNKEADKVAEVQARPVPVVNWHEETTKDSVTGVVGSIFYNTSTNSVNFSFPYNVEGGSFLNLVFRKRKEGTDAYVVISKGQMICGYSDCSIRTKGDDGKVRNWAASNEASGRSDMIFIDKPQAFEKYIKNNKKVTIGVTFYQAGEQGFDFDVAEYPVIKNSKER